MDDRELLELAARAAGILKWQHAWVDAGLNVGSDASPAIWNPLTDDGDAFRLAVKLDLIVSRDYLTGERTVLKYKASTLEQLVRVAESLDDDPRAATRRAITRAAATIGQEITNAQG